MDISKIITAVTDHKEQIIKASLVVGSGIIGVALAAIHRSPQEDEIIILETEEPVLEEEKSEEDPSEKE